MANYRAILLREKVMMRKLFTAVLFAVLAFSVAPAEAYASVNKAQDEVLLIKKKKKLAELKAAEEKKRAAVAAETAKLKAAKLKTAKLKAEKMKPARVSARRDCGTFMQCLFGKSRRSNALSSSGLSGRSMRKQVAWNETKYAPGTLIVKTPERALYYVLGDGEAMRYSIGVGREGFQWGGSSKIVAKAEWPTWTPPQIMIEREAAKGHHLPAMMPGGPGNPLGARAMYIGGTIYRVHGTNSESSIGGAVSSGCIRMMNADVIDLYGRVKIGTPIYVYQ
jgi:lipoprotein-anchoring transpeptidase ErfK/SrfK